MKRKFGFMFMIFAMISLASCESKGKKISCKPENFREKISELKSEGTYNVIVTGTISNNKKFLDDLAAALKQDRTVKIHLDLSESEGLKEFYSGASNLLGVSLPPSFKKLSTKSFRGKNIKYVDFPKGNERFIAEGNAIYTKNHKILGAVLAGVTELNVAEGTEKIVYGAIENLDNLEKVMLPSTLTELESNNFVKCPSLTLVDSESSQIKKIVSCFNDLPNVQVKLPKTLEYLEESFKNSKIINIKLPEKLNYMYHSFIALDDITEIELPDSLEFVIKSFVDCKKINRINFGNNLKILYSGFTLCPELKSISLPASLIRLAKYNNFTEKIVNFSDGEWYFDIELADASGWIWNSSKDACDPNEHKFENLSQEILSSPEKLGEFINTESFDTYYGGIWKNEYDVISEPSDGVGTWDDFCLNRNF